MTAIPESDEPFAQAHRAFLARDVAHFSTPGHKRRAELIGDDPLLAGDVPHACGVDDARMSRDLLGRAERLAARLWGADWVRFSVHGSTHPNQAVCLGIARPGDRVVVARTSHKSIFTGLVLAGLEPVWVSPDVDESSGLALSVPAERVERALAQAPDARAVLLVEPSYLGLVSDVARIADAAHAAGVPLHCDQAWGAHFGLHPALPPALLARGADAISISVHKTLSAFTQGAMLLAREGRLDLERLAAAFDALYTTSPSAAILASIDRSRALVERDGTRLVGDALLLAERFRNSIDGHRGARCVDGRTLTAPSVAGWDPLKLVVDLSRSGADGFDVEQDLLAEGIYLEMADRTTLVPLLTIGDDERSVGRLIDGLRASLDRRAGTAQRAQAASPAWRAAPQVAMTPRDAFFAPRRRVPAADAVGRVSAEIVAPYPPGIPALAPGELVDAELLAALHEEAAAGTRMAGVSDKTLATLLVVDA